MAEAKWILHMGDERLGENTMRDGKAKRNVRLAFSRYVTVLFHSFISVIIFCARRNV